MDNSKKNLVLFCILTAVLLFIGSICTSLFANNNTVMQRFYEYASLIQAVLLLFFSLFFSLKRKNPYIFVLLLYLIFFGFQFLVILNVKIEKGILFLFAINVLASILLVNYLRTLEFQLKPFTSSLPKQLATLFLLFIFEISAALYVFIGPSFIHKFVFSISNEIYNLLPWNMITSLVTLCGALFIIKFSLKMNLKEFLQNIGILSKKDLRTGIFVFISILIFIQSAGIFVSLFLDYPYSLKNFRFTSWHEWFLSLIDLFGVGFYEEIVFRGFLFYTLCCAVNINKKPLFHFIFVIALSQSLFSLSHLPRMLIHFDLPISEIIIGLIHYFIMGVFFVICYIRTKSIYAAIFIHTLVNFSTPIYNSGYPLGFLADSKSLLILFVITLLILWDCFPKFNKRKVYNSTPTKGHSNS
ncbi:CPBP family intramembrane glutamic endopeptidase [Cytobacillus massiliigabonensis]|uniref:CPBP family intramembrane glutamic endopeptidase n=1 Tax=Cytobacillus massiliigabonensis TaxID=1871011 RepID=UPI000C8468ED|nr:type II CAAX endopeptidase family protein [Cytobacillus massiliigabonensis]